MIVTAAQQLYDCGLNVFPLCKTRSHHATFRHVRYTRINRDQIPEVFAGRCDIGVAVGGRTPPYFFVLRCASEAIFNQHAARLRSLTGSLWAVKTTSSYDLWLLSTYGRLTLEEHEITSQVWQEQGIEIIGSEASVLAPPSMDEHVQCTWLLQEGAAPPSVHVNQLGWLPILRERPPDRRVRLRDLTADFTQQRQSQTIEMLIAELTRRMRLNDPEVLHRVRDCGGSIKRAAYELFDSDHRPPRKLTDYREAVAAYLIRCLKPETKSQITDFTVLVALLWHLSRLDYRRSFRASAREVAEYAHIDKSTALASLDRLLDAGILERVASDRRSQAHRYRFTDAVIQAGKPHIYDLLKSRTLRLYTYPDPPLLRITSHPDLLEAGMLTLPGALLYTLLTLYPTGLAGKDIHQHLPLSQQKLDRLCRRLEKLGLIRAERRSGRASIYFAESVTEQELERLPARYGAAGKSEKRRAAHRGERALEAGRRLIEFRKQHDPGYKTISE